MSKPGYSDVVLGTQYGDEGKARIVDELAKNYDIVARFNGGANAGHTIVKNGQKVALHQVPSGIFHEEKELFIGSGCVVNVEKLAKEIDTLEALGFKLRGRLHISSQAGLIQAHHILLDGHIGKSVGTTRNGIGPAYADRALRMWGDRLLNIRLCDFLNDRDLTLKQMAANYEASCKALGINEEAINFDELARSFEKIVPYIELNPLFLPKKLEDGSRVIFEGAQAFMLDVNKGSVPFVTSSPTSAAAAYLGGDLAPNHHGTTFGIAKALMSRVGHGPFPSEFGGAQSEEYCMSFNSDGSPLHPKEFEETEDLEKMLSSADPFELGKALRRISAEYGTVTKRPRRVGVLDLVQLSYAIRMNGIAGLFLTKCDILQYFSKTRDGRIPLVTGYELDGQAIDYVPSSTVVYGRVKPIIEYRPAFSEDISAVRDENDLPASLRALLTEIGDRTQCKIIGIGVGPERDQFVNLKNNV